MTDIKHGLYIHFEEIDNPGKSGILNKIIGQIEAFNDLGYQFDQVYFKNKKELFLNSDRLLRMPSRILDFRYFIFKKILNVIKINTYSLIYIRYVGSDRHFVNFLKKIKGFDIEVILEFPTFPYDDEKNPTTFIERRIVNNDRKYRNELKEHVTKAISCSHEGDIFGMKTLNIENGISIRKIPLTTKAHSEQQLILIGVANIAKWHGYDRVIYGLSNYYKNNPNYKVSFRIVGSGSELSRLKTLSDQLGLSKEVVFCGPKMGEDLDSEFMQSHLAVGSLGMHRIGLRNGSILKLAEYTARGFASIIAYNDYRIEDNCPFVLKLPDNDLPVEIETIISFYNKMELTQQQIREFAETHFTWLQQIKKIIEDI